MRVVAIVQARMSSTRLPGKVLADIEGRPMLQRVLDRLEYCSELDDIGIATSKDPSDDPIYEKFEKVFRGSLADPLQRYLLCARHISAKIIVRVAGDCPCIDPAIVDGAVRRFKSLGCEYLTNDTREVFSPSGFDVEVFSYDLLSKVNKEAKGSDREHVVAAHVFKNYQRFDVTHYLAPSWCYGSKFSVDTEADLEKVRRVYANLSPTFSAEDVRKFFGIPQEVFKY